MSEKDGGPAFPKEEKNMSEYHKIQTVFKRDMASKYKNLLEGEFSLPEFRYLAENIWTFTEKVDGTNVRVTFNPDNRTVYFGGKTDAAMLPANLVDRLNHRFQTTVAREKGFEVFPKGAILYGEGYGPKIQKGGELYRSDQDFVLFDVRVGHWWLQREDVEKVANSLGLDVVPIVGEGTIYEAIRKVREGFNSTWGEFKAEGLVLRPSTELRTRSGERIITKIKHRDFAPTR
jgi:ATP-dependent RNA circularization protein (DNA/RNA ligase family)